MKISTLVCSILLLTLAVSADQDHCYGLVLEGGGDLGAFQAGALHELIHTFADKTVAYDIVTGISVGALNGAGLANFKQGEEIEASEFILDLWRGLSRDEVLKNWNWVGIVRGILFETSLWDSTPL
jgi:predicted acylesterase/phospholipase RssA